MDSFSYREENLPHEKKKIVKILALCAAVTMTATLFTGCKTLSNLQKEPDVPNMEIISTTNTGENFTLIGSWVPITVIKNDKDWTFEEYCAENEFDKEDIQTTLYLNPGDAGTLEMGNYDTPIRYEVKKNKLTIFTQVAGEDDHISERSPLFTPSTRKRVHSPSWMRKATPALFLPRSIQRNAVTNKFY